jgi:hypothetical protein
MTFTVTVTSYLISFRYGELEGKELAMKSPLQWSIFADNFIPEDGFQSQLDEEIFDIASHSPAVSEFDSNELCPQLRESVVSAVLQSVTQPPRYPPYPSSIESIIQLAQDVFIDSKSPGDVSSGYLDKHAEITKAAPAFSSEHTSRAGDVDAAPSASFKRNPFVSAKEQFGKEVCVCAFLQAFVSDVSVCRAGSSTQRRGPPLTVGQWAPCR